MENKISQLQKVASILRNWKGSDAGEEALSNELAMEIDKVYVDHVASLPKQLLAIRRGQKDWERKVA